MGYQFQVVPLREFERHQQRLQLLPEPIDRASALPVAACALLLQDSAERCLAGLAEEKRLLAIWVRQGRMGVRLIRGKGSASERAWANASLSNAADQARNSLDRLALEAPRGRDQALRRLGETSRFVRPDEARAFIPAYLDGVRAAEQAGVTRALCLLLYVAGGVVLFLAWPLGLALLALAGLLQLCCRSSWQAVARAESQRQRQRGEVQTDAAEARSFLERLDQATSARDPELDAAAIAAIAADLRRQHVYLEVACRELGSRALSWEQLAAEIMPAQQLVGTDGKPKAKTDDARVARCAVTPPPLPSAVQPQTAPSTDHPRATPAAQPSPAAAPRPSPAGPITAPPDERVVTAADPRGVAPPIPPLPPLRAASDPAELGGLGLTSAPPLEIPLRHEAAAVVFDLDLQGVQAILRRLGYRRLPRSWSALSARAQQRVSVYLAALVSVRAEAYRWSFEEGAVRATLLKGCEEG